MAGLIIDKVVGATRLWGSVCIKGSRIMYGEDKGDVYMIDLENSEHNKTAYPTGEPSGTGGVFHYWYSLATEGDIAIAGQHGGRLYISEDYGVTWNDRSPSGGNRNYLAATIETVNEITTIVVGDNQGIYKSTDLGLNWSRLDPIGDDFSFGKFFSIDADGVNYVAADLGDQSWLPGRIYTSTDRGITWTERYPAGDTRQEWRAVAIDGDYILAGIDGGRLYLSIDKGISWNEIQPAGNNDFHWGSVAITGNLMLAGIDCGQEGAYGIGRVYLSEDYGVTWEEIQPYGDEDKRWLNADGDNDMIVFAPFGGEVWKIYYAGQELTTISAERSSAYANIILSGEIVSSGGKLNSRGFEYIIQDAEPTEEDSGTEVLEESEGEGFADEEYEIHTGDELRTLYNLDNDKEDWEATTIWWFRAIGYSGDTKYYGEWLKNVPTVATGAMDNQLALNSIPMINAHGEVTDKGANDVIERGFRIVKEYQGDLQSASYYISIGFGDFEVMVEMESHTILGGGDGYTVVDYYWTGTFYRDSTEEGNFDLEAFQRTLGGGIGFEGLGIYLKPNDTYLIQAIAKNELGWGFGEQVSITTLQGTSISVDDDKLDSNKFEKTVTLGTVPSGCEVTRVGIRLGRTKGCNELHYFEDGSFSSGSSVTFMVELEYNSKYYIMSYYVIDYGSYEEEILGMMNYTDPDMEDEYLTNYPVEVTDDLEDDDDLDKERMDAGGPSYDYRSILKEIKCEKIGEQGLIDYYGRRRSQAVSNHLVQTKSNCGEIIDDYLDRFQRLKLKVAVDIDMPIPFEREDVILLGDGKTKFRNTADGLVLFKADGEGEIIQRNYILAKVRKWDINHVSGNETIINLELEV